MQNYNASNVVHDFVDEAAVLLLVVNCLLLYPESRSEVLHEVKEWESSDEIPRIIAKEMDG